MNNNSEIVESKELSGFLDRMQFFRQDENIIIGFVSRMGYRDIQELGYWLKDHDITPIYQTFANPNQILKIVKITGGNVDE